MFAVAQGYKLLCRSVKYFLSERRGAIKESISDIIEELMYLAGFTEEEKQKMRMRVGLALLCNDMELTKPRRGCYFEEIDE